MRDQQRAKVLEREASHRSDARGGGAGVHHEDALVDEHRHAGLGTVRSRHRCRGPAHEHPDAAFRRGLRRPRHARVQTPRQEGVLGAGTVEDELPGGEGDHREGADSDQQCAHTRFRMAPTSA